LRLFQAILEKEEHEAASRIARLTNLGKAEEIRPQELLRHHDVRGRDSAIAELELHERHRALSRPLFRIAVPSPLYSLASQSEAAARVTTFISQRSKPKTIPAAFTITSGTPKRRPGNRSAELRSSGRALTSCTWWSLSLPGLNPLPRLDASHDKSLGKESN
jgi:hypothetical protein